jgi:hypothetical protein
LVLRKSWLRARSPFARGATVTAVPSRAFERVPQAPREIYLVAGRPIPCELAAGLSLAGSGISLQANYFAFFFAVFFAAFFAVFFAAFFFAAMFVSPFLCFVFEVLLSRVLAFAATFILEAAGFFAGALFFAIIFFGVVFFFADEVVRLLALAFVVFFFFPAPAAFAAFAGPDTPFTFLVGRWTASR